MCHKAAKRFQLGHRHKHLHCSKILRRAEFSSWFSHDTQPAENPSKPCVWLKRHWIDCDCWNELQGQTLFFLVQTKESAEANAWVVSSTLMMNHLKPVVSSSLNLRSIQIMCVTDKLIVIGKWTPFTKSLLSFSRTRKSLGDSLDCWPWWFAGDSCSFFGWFAPRETWDVNGQLWLWRWTRLTKLLPSFSWRERV